MESFFFSVLNANLLQLVMNSHTNGAALGSVFGVKYLAQGYFGIWTPEARDGSTKVLIEPQPPYFFQ